MPIHFTTGIPGAGKTQLVIAQALTMAGVTDHSSVDKIREQIATVATRPLFVCGVEGWQLGDLVPIIDDPNGWRDLPDGSVVIVDEAWKWWGDQVANVGKDPRYLALAEHRHYGYDFFLTAQGPTQLHKHVKVLSGPYEHVARKFGTKTTVVWTWPTVEANPNSDAAKLRALDRVWSYNPVIQQLYQSATVHTIKRKIPLKMILAIAALPLIAGLCIFAWKAVSSIGKNKKDPEVAAVVAGTGAAVDGSVVEAPMTTEQWVARFVPRVAHEPTSAPAYDDREVVATPRLFCAVGGAGENGNGEHVGESCGCLTEQGTRYVLTDARCRLLVAEGGTYDPFREPAPVMRDAGQQAPVQAGGSPASTAPEVAEINGEQVAPYGDLGKRAITAAP